MLESWHEDDAGAELPEELANAIAAAQRDNLKLLQELANQNRLYIKRSAGEPTLVTQVGTVIGEPNRLGFKTSDEDQPGLKSIEIARLHEYLSLR